MRILFSFAGNAGHLDPLLPVARAAAAAGHTVAVSGRPLMVPAIEAAEFAAFPSGSDAGGEPQHTPLRRLDIAAEERDFGQGFVLHHGRQRAADLRELGARWRPDLLVRDDCDFGAVVAAELLGVRYATVTAIAAGLLTRPEVVAGPWQELRAGYRLPPDPEVAALHRYLVLAPVPPGFRDPRYPLPPTAHLLRPSVLDAPVPDRSDRELPDGTGRPLIYVTLGTIFNTESGDLFARVLAGLRELPVDAVVTVGAAVDPASFGPQPPGVHVTRYLPQARVLPHCAAVVSHGGSGSVLGALAYGLPSVLLPMGADQPHNAAQCLRLGVARVLDAVDATARDIRDAVAAVLTEPGYRRAAARVRDAAAGLPGPEHAVTLLEKVARDESVAPARSTEA